MRHILFTLDKGCQADSCPKAAKHTRVINRQTRAHTPTGIQLQSQAGWQGRHLGQTPDTEVILIFKKVTQKWHPAQKIVNRLYHCFIYGPRISPVSQFVLTHSLLLTSIITHVLADSYWVYISAPCCLHINQPLRPSVSNKNRLQKEQIDVSMQASQIGYPP